MSGRDGGFLEAFISGASRSIESGAIHMARACYHIDAVNYGCASLLDNVELLAR